MKNILLALFLAGCATTQAPCPIGAPMTFTIGEDVNQEAQRYADLSGELAKYETDRNDKISGIALMPKTGNLGINLTPGEILGQYTAAKVFSDFNACGIYVQNVIELTDTKQGFGEIYPMPGSFEAKRVYDQIKTGRVLVKEE